jgi:uroporphyrinogen-III decarboxylase
MTTKVVSSNAVITRRKAAWQEFYDLESSRRFLWIIRPKEGQPAPRPWPNPENKQARIEHAWQQYLWHLERIHWYEDALVPYLDPYTGTEIFAEAFGCRVYRPEDNMPFALPLVNSAREAEKLRPPDISAPPLALLFEIADELRRRSGPQALMKLVDIQSPMDIAALIWNKETFYPALIETPEVVLDLAGKVKTLLVAFLEEWFRRYGRDFVAHFPEYYMPVGITLSEDEVGAVSARMFDQYFLPELNELSDHFGGIGVHCCANARHQWKGFKQIHNLRLINLVQPMDELVAAHTFFESVTTQMNGWDVSWELEKAPAQFPSKAHLVLQANVETKLEAQRLAEMMERLYG